MALFTKILKACDSLRLSAAVLFATCPLVLSAAESVVFLTGNASATEDKLFLADQDGGGLSVLVSNSSFTAVPGRTSVDRVNRRIYVCDQTSGGGGIFRFNADGSGKTTIFSNATSGTQILGVAADGTNGFIYFVAGNASAAEDKLYRADLNGGSPTVLVSGASFTNVPNSVAVDTVNQRVYVVDQTTSGGGVFRFNSDGSGKTTIYANSTSGSQVLGIAVDATRSFVYFITGNATASEDKLFRCDLNGGSLTTLVSGASLSNIPTQLAVDVSANRLYVVDATTAGGGVFRFNADVTGKTTIYANSTSGSQVLGVTMLPPVSTTVSSLNRVNSTPSNSSTVNWTLTFGSATTGVTASNFSLSGTATSGASIGTPTTANSGLTWNIPVTTGSASGTLQLDFANATGLSQAVSTSLPFSGQAYSMDKTAPTISIGSPSASLTNTGPITYTVTYSDANFSSSTLANGNVTLNSTGSASGTVNVTGSGTTRTVTISSITGDGTLGISISAGTASDTAGNTAAAAGPSTTFTVDNTAPTISIGAPSASLTSGGPVTYTVTYSDANFSASTLANGNITLNSTGSASGTVNVTGSGTTRTVTISSITGDGTLGISISAGTASDTAGNTAAAAGPSTTFTVDNTAPVITSGASASGDYRTAGFSYTITASGSATIYGASGLPSGLGVDSGSGAITGTPTQAGTFNVTITATDAAGNVDSDPLTITINAAALTVTGATADNKPYDGGTGASLNLGGAALSGVLGGDDVSLITGSATGAFDTSTVGTGKTVTVSGLTLSGADSGNYTLAQPTTVADITAVQLTVTADNKTRPYGYANPTLTATITGFVGGETSAVLSGSAELSTSATGASAPGGYTITAAVGTLSATNYTFSFVDGTLTVRLLEIGDWESENFTPSELLDPGISGPDADPDLDGVTNLYEYAFGTDQNDIGSGPDPLVYVGTFAGGGTLSETGQPVSRTETTPTNTTRVLFVRRNLSFSGDISYVVQFSSNGTTWVSSSATPTLLASSGLLEVVSVPYTQVVGGKKARFFRVVAEVN